MSAEVESMFSVREVPWHGLGTIIPETVTSAEAIKLAGLDWEVKKESIYLDNGDELDGFKATVRQTDKQVFSVVSDRYMICQNDKAFDFVDELLKVNVRYETAGSLYGGKKIWLLAHLPKRTIMGDDVVPYLCFTNSHDGTGAIKAVMTPTRVVCRNTLAIALQNATKTWSTKHIGSIEDKIKTAERSLGLAENYMVKFEEVAETLQDIKIPDIIQATHTLVPYPEDKPSERIRDNIDYVRSGIISRMKAPDIQKFGNSGWAYLNAVSDWVCHSEPLRLTTDYQMKRFDSLLGGTTLIDEAYSLINSWRTMPLPARERITELTISL